MDQYTLTTMTTTPPDDVVLLAVHFFSNEKFTLQSQSNRMATFQGRPHFSLVHLLLTALGLVFCIVPGIILLVLFIAQTRKLQNVVVSVNSAASGTAVAVTFPGHASDIARRFLSSLPVADASLGRPLFAPAPQQYYQPDYQHGPREYRATESAVGPSDPQASSRYHSAPICPTSVPIRRTAIAPCQNCGEVIWTDNQNKECPRCKTWLPDEILANLAEPRS